MEEIPKTFGTFDIVAAVVILALALRCVLRGFIREVFSLAGIIGGIILARLYFTYAAGLFTPWVENRTLANSLGFASICLSVILISAIASWLISRIIRRTFFGVLDRLGGLVVGALQGVLLAGLFVWVVVAAFGSLDNSFLKNSVLAPYLLDTIMFIAGKVSPAIHQQISPDIQSASIFLSGLFIA